jgi:SAM-dependent methyltransferase
MDLRPFHPTGNQAEAAAQLLRYQPFVIDDDRQTGVAYTWMHSPDPTRVSSEDFFFDRKSVTAEVWDKACDANRRLGSMYDAFIARIVDVCPPGGSYLDIACNTGYFPVRASLAGVQTAAGIDLGDFSSAFQLLNEITGSSAKFAVGGYDSGSHSLTMPANFGPKSYDVVSSSAFLCHVPDPLHFLKSIATLASRAVFLWSGFVESEELLIRYNPPNKFTAAEFPNGFEDGTSISLGLLFLSMAKLGFVQREELKPAPDWLPEDWHSQGIPDYQKFRAFLFWR